ncbi:MAG TPA: hypothetical protein DCR95_07190, partial [Desulfobacter sp.]|nr:hypothetical protein [Desulfobacter sp.]
MTVNPAGNYIKMKDNRAMSLSQEEIKAAVLARANEPIVSTSPIEEYPEQQPRKYSESTIWNFHQANEYGDAQLFINIFKNQYIYDHAENQWYYWNDHYWRQDVIKQILTQVDAVVEVYGEEMLRQDWNATKAKKAGDDTAAESADKKAKAYRKRIDLLQTLKRREIVVKLSSMGLSGLGTPGDQWDLSPFLFCCKNGVIDLKTGECQPGQQMQMLKTFSPTAWESLDAECPVFEKFMMDIFNDDIEIVNYIQKLLGYCITGDQSNHIVPIFWGIGRNGKSTLLETINHVLGAFSGPIESDTLLQQRFGKSSGSASSDIMVLRGKRLVWASETDEGRSISGSKIKMLSGGDAITGRELYKNNVTFPATHHAILMTNHKPHAQAGDYALWNRIRLIPFEVSFVNKPTKDFERQADKHLIKKLK